MKWTRIGAASDFAEGKGRTLRLQGRRIAIFRYADELYAIDAVCPHTGADLGLGRVKNRRVSCPEHGWTFDLSTGCMPGAKEIAVQTFPVKIDGEQLFVDIAGPAETAGNRGQPG
ncbi:MAG: Rieske 2Fe-2S domain-containing protein [Deltaproteobacteria bacterium]|nr:Rieske 2Fe-2S domain-containing protein [Deltaproteobacteria bacterium]